MKKKTSCGALYQRVREILESARAGVARTVNTTQVVANWLIGREIVEEEQRGRQRAEYGARLVADLSRNITADFGQGYSITNLEHFRDFYLTYPQLLSQRIPHAMRGESEASKIPHTLRRKSEKSYALRSQSENPAEIANAVRSELAIHHALRGELEIGHTVRDQFWQPGQLHPDAAVEWLEQTVYRAISDFQRDVADGGREAALIFWLADPKRVFHKASEDTYHWHCTGEHRNKSIPIGRCLWNGAEGSARRIITKSADKNEIWAGLFHPRIS